MHGIILNQLQSYVTKGHGAATWRQLLETAGVGSRTYLASKTYPDEEVVAIVGAASKLTGTPAEAILEDFGAFIVPALLETYGPLLKKEWRTLDLLENTETVIHKVVRFDNPGADPPQLVIERRAPDVAVLQYSSARKMCSVAKGIAKGIAGHYGETLRITDEACMNRGDPSCRITFQTV